MVRVEICGDLNLQTIEQARARLAGAFAERRGVLIDCSTVATCDLSGAQLIISALKTAVRDRQAAHVLPPTSGALVSAFSRAGLMEAFEALTANCAFETRLEAVT